MLQSIKEDLLTQLSNEDLDVGDIIRANGVYIECVGSDEFKAKIKGEKYIELTYDDLLNLIDTY